MVINFSNHKQSTTIPTVKTITMAEAAPTSNSKITKTMPLKNPFILIKIKIIPPVKIEI